MKVSVQWLKELVDLGDMPVAALADTLTMGGLEVEEVTRSPRTSPASSWATCWPWRRTPTPTSCA